MRPAPPVVLVLRPSRALFISVLVCHTLAALAVLMAQLDFVFAALLLGVVLASAYRHRSSPTCPALVLWGDGQFEKIGAGDTALSPHPSSSRLGPLAILRFREAGRLQALVLMPDSFTNKDDWRYFCRWFYWQAPAVVKMA
jgi:hypothetical protein